MMTAARGEALAALRDRLRATPELRPVSVSEDHVFWLHDLASTVEGAFGELVPFTPGTAPAEQEAEWSQRLGGWWQRRFAAGLYGDDLSDRYWITIPGRDGVAAGTIAVGRLVSGNSHAKLFSLYVAPPFRRQGIASRTLGQVHSAALASGLSGITLDTDWVRQDTLRFYLTRRMWIAGWKHGITFVVSSHLPRYQIDAPSDASLVFSIDEGASMRPLLAASNDGDRLGWQETDLCAQFIERRDHLVAIRAQATLALACAVRGWPLIRSESAWENRFLSSDVGGPEGLAYKIGLFEAEALNDGWVVRTPQIPDARSADVDA